MSKTGKAILLILIYVLIVAVSGWFVVGMYSDIAEKDKRNFVIVAEVLMIVFGSVFIYTKLAAED